MKKKKEFNLGTITGTCVDYSHDGKGIIRREEEKPVFVDGLLLNETADVKLTYETSEIVYGKILKLHNLSQDRIKPLCPVGTACGGCCFQNLNYDAQLAFKKHKVEEAFRKIAHLKVEINDVIGMEHPYHYRNKIQMPIGLNQKKEIIYGFYRTKSHEIIPIKECFIEDERGKEILENIKILMKKYRIDPYNEDKREGIIRHILIRTSRCFSQIMVVLVTNCDEFKGRNNFVKELHKLCPQITTIVQNINTRDSNVILGDKERVLMGSGYIRDKLCDVTFQISAKSFFQVNPVQTEKLYSRAIEYANIDKNNIVLDAFCGIGTIGLIAASKAKKVVGVEVIKEAISDAKSNAKLNGINNVEFHVGDASEFVKDLSKSMTKIDIAFVDPPRKGLDEQFIDSLKLLKSEKIVYISCEPSTLARDIHKLMTNYDIKGMTVVDMFPMTFHVETIVLLEKKGI